MPKLNICVVGLAKDLTDEVCNKLATELELYYANVQKILEFELFEFIELFVLFELIDLFEEIIIWKFAGNVFLIFPFVDFLNNGFGDELFVFSWSFWNGFNRDASSGLTVLCCCIFTIF